MRDRIAALALLVVSIVYGLMASRIELYPGVEQEGLSPRGFPLLLGTLGVVFSLALLFQRPSSSGDGESPPLAESPRRLQWRRVLLLCALMLLYGALLRPLGFLLATMLFLFGCLWTLGERRRTVLIAVPALVAVLLFSLLRWLLGIYLADPLVDRLAQLILGWSR